jgi:hypothetical protein
MIYFAMAEGTDLVKIGFTDGPVEKRLAQLQTGCPNKLILLSDNNRGGEEQERELHEELKADRVTGEWFRLSPRVLIRIAQYTSPESRVLAQFGLEIGDRMDKVENAIAELRAIKNDYPLMGILSAV